MFHNDAAVNRVIGQPGNDDPSTRGTCIGWRDDPENANRFIGEGMILPSEKLL